MAMSHCVITDKDGYPVKQEEAGWSDTYMNWTGQTTSIGVFFRKEQTGDL
jgi:hypothetical protein